MFLQVELIVIATAISILQSQGAAIEAAIGPFLVTVENGVPKIANEIFAKLPLGIGVILNGLFTSYWSGVEADITQYENSGLAFVITWLQNLQSKLKGGSIAPKPASAGFPTWKF